MPRPPRIAVRAVIVHDDRLLLVNAYRGRTDLWCAPGGGVEPHFSLPDNLRRELREETGLEVTVGAVCLVNEFHDPAGDFHQIDIYFRGTVSDGTIAADWSDPEGVVSHHRWVTQSELAQMRVKPDALASVAWDETGAIAYDPLEPILR